MPGYRLVNGPLFGGKRVIVFMEVAGLGAGAGNTPTEVFVAVCERMGIVTGCDLFQLMDMAEDMIVPMMEHRFAGLCRVFRCCHLLPLTMFLT